MLVEIVQNDIGYGVALELVNNPHPLPVGLIPYGRNAVQFLLGNQLGGFFHHIGLINHVGNLCDHDHFPTRLSLLYGGLPAHDYPASSSFKGRFNSVVTVNNTSCRKVRSNNMLHQLRSEEHTSELQSRENLVCRLLLEKKKKL